MLYGMFPRPSTKILGMNLLGSFRSFFFYNLEICSILHVDILSLVVAWRGSAKGRGSWNEQGERGEGWEPNLKGAR
jgi:hypothetical protein